MIRLNRRTAILALVICAAASLAFVAIPRMVQALCGNSRIVLYGRIVNEFGDGVAGIQVDVQILYSDRVALPVMYGRVERVGVVTTYSDADGNFRVGPAYGYSVTLRRLSRNGQDVALAKKAPDIGGSMDSRSERARMPTTPSKRITYVVADR